MANPELYVRAKAAGLLVEEVEVSDFARETGKSSHDLMRVWRIFLDVNRDFLVLRKKLP